MLLLFCLAVRLDSQPSQGRTLRNLPESIPVLMECQEPPKTPKNPVYPNFMLYDKMNYLLLLDEKSLHGF